MRSRILSALFVLALPLALPAGAAGAAGATASRITLRGSHGSMVRQNAVARENDFTFLRTAGQIGRFVELGVLVPLPGTGDLETAGVSYPYTRPETATFVRRLASQYRQACGAPLVVTSLTRPLAEQPRNASPLSVHPTGMAVDLRVPAQASCREWLASALLGLESKGVLDVTREYRPAHFHVAVFPDRYMAYARPLIAADSVAAAAAARQAARAEPAPLRAALGPAPTPAAGGSAQPPAPWEAAAAVAALALLLFGRRAFGRVARLAPVRRLLRPRG